MENQTRIAWCRRSFIAICVLPTALIVLWIGWRSLPHSATAHKADWERELSTRLGMRVTITEVAYPAISVCELTQVELADAETGEPLARASHLEISQTEEGWGIEARSVEIEMRHAGRLAAILHDRLLCQGSAQIARCEFSAQELTFQDESLSQSLVGVFALVEPLPEGPKFTASFQWPEAATAGDGVELVLSRTSAQNRPVTRTEVDTGQTAIPCALLAKVFQVFPALSALGETAQCQGSADIVCSSAGWSGEFKGRATGVDLDSLVSEQFPHLLSGSAELTMEQAAVENGRIISAAGTIDVKHGGKISRSLLAAAQQHLQLQPQIAADAPETLSFRRLALGFRIDGERIRLSGSADGSAPGAVIANHSGPILAAPPKHSAPAVALIRTLLPESQVQVPATQQTAFLVHLLPVPELVATKSARRPTHIPTRLAPGGSASPAGVVRER